MKDLSSHYVEKGFFWSRDLELLLIEFGDKTLPFLHPVSKTIEKLSFDISRWIAREKSDYATFENIEAVIKEEVVPIAEENPESDGILWTLTKSGKLYGYHDFAVYRMGDPDDDWRTALNKLIKGEAPFFIGNAMDYIDD
jgi:hypothetical protein